jgi:hypothetical protein
MLSRPTGNMAVVNNDSDDDYDDDDNNNIFGMNMFQNQ